MVLSLTVNPGGGRLNTAKCTHEIILPHEIQCYLAQFDHSRSLIFLAGCDPYNDTEIPVDILNELAVDLKHLGIDAQNRIGPAPPNYVNIEEADDPRGEAFGWEGLIEWITQLSEAISIAESADSNIYAVGD